jgi:hypothetical protein
VRFISFTGSNHATDLIESLSLLRQLQTQYVPPLPETLLTYLNAQHRFIVAVAKQYRGKGVEWPQLLAAGQQGLVRAWQATQGDLTRLDCIGTWWVRQAILERISLDAADRPETLQRSGLFTRRHSGHELYLYFRGRLIFKKWLPQLPGTSRIFHQGEGPADSRA